MNAEVLALVLRVCCILGLDTLLFGPSLEIMRTQIVTSTLLENRIKKRLKEGGNKTK